MQRICFLLKVKQHLLEQYKETHRNVWPEMQPALRVADWDYHSLFLGEDGLLIGYLETDDCAAAREKLVTSELNANWQAEMAPYSEQLDGLRAPSWRRARSRRWSAAACRRTKRRRRPACIR